MKASPKRLIKAAQKILLYWDKYKHKLSDSFGEWQSILFTEAEQELYGENKERLEVCREVYNAGK